MCRNIVLFLFNACKPSTNAVFFPQSEIHVWAMVKSLINLLKPTGYVMHHQFNIQQLYALPTLYLCFVFI
jgi:hypothetical protein